MCCLLMQIINSDMKIVRIVDEMHMRDVRLLFRAYATELNENLCFQGFEDELQSPLKKYGPPNGALFLAYKDDVAIGCIALQPLKEHGVCEMKRLFVTPSARGGSVAKNLVITLLASAKNMGYSKMVLDTLQRLQPAIKLYLQFGFTYTSGYYDNPLNDAVYMQKVL